MILGEIQRRGRSDEKDQQNRYAHWQLTRTLLLLRHKRGSPMMKGQNILSCKHSKFNDLGGFFNFATSRINLSGQVTRCSCKAFAYIKNLNFISMKFIYSDVITKKQLVHQLYPFACIKDSEPEKYK